MTDALQYPDLSIVVLYRKLVIGCAFLIPDVKVRAKRVFRVPVVFIAHSNAAYYSTQINEAYITFVVTHPEWQGAGIGSFMLYHLTQVC